MADRFLIAPLNSGWQNDMVPWLIADDAYESLENAYVWRGRVRKRVGARLMGQGVPSAVAPLLSRLRRNLGLIPGGGTLNVAALDPRNVGMQFSVEEDVILTVVSAAAGPQAMLTTNAGLATGTFDVTTGNVSITGTIGDTVYFYPALPVMRLDEYQDRANPINGALPIGFDTQNIYWYPNGGNGWDEFLINPVFPNGTINHFIDSTSYTSTFDNNVLFATSFDGTSTGAMIYWDNTGFTATAFAPSVIPATRTVTSCRMIRVFKGRLLLINVTELQGGTTSWFPQRIRFSAFQQTISTNAFTEFPQVGSQGAGFVEIPLQEEILGADFLGDRLIVFTDQSTWELVWTGNNIVPFKFIQIENNYGCESPQSTVAFERNIFAVGGNSFTTTNGNTVTRMDRNIPDEVFKIGNTTNGQLRVSGIWDKYNMLVYFAAPFDDMAPTQIYPSVIFVYNPENNTWALNDDAITAFGYYENQPAFTWADWTTPWSQSTWQWQTGQNQAYARQTIAGNQEGFTFIIDRDVPQNSKALSITNIVNAGGGVLTLTIIDHMLQDRDFILIENATGTVADAIYAVTFVTKDTIQIDATFLGAYVGGGWVTRVSEIDIWTKQLNPYRKVGANVQLIKSTFAVARTSFGEITVNYYSSSSSVNNNVAGIASGSQLGTSVLETFPYDATRLGSNLETFSETLWHDVYFQGLGNSIQLNLYLADDADINESQIRNRNIALSPFELQGMLIVTQPVSSRLQ